MQTGAAQFFQLSKRGEGAPQRIGRSQIFASGGRLIRNEAGEIIGAVGVTGDVEARDEELAAHGIRAAGLKTDEDCAGLGHRVRLKN